MEMETNPKWQNPFQTPDSVSYLCFGPSYLHIYFQQSFEVRNMVVHSIIIINSIGTIVVSKYFVPEKNAAEFQRRYARKNYSTYFSNRTHLLYFSLLPIDYFFTPKDITSTRPDKLFRLDPQWWCLSSSGTLQFF